MIRTHMKKENKREIIKFKEYKYSFKTRCEKVKLTLGQSDILNEKGRYAH